jgi:hypothetical protein
VAFFWQELNTEIYDDSESCDLRPRRAGKFINHKNLITIIFHLVFSDFLFFRFFYEIDDLPLTPPTRSGLLNYMNEYLKW